MPIYLLKQIFQVIYSGLEGEDLLINFLLQRLKLSTMLGIYVS
jgi:hypothetical protein